ncbi:Uncharacterised protein [Mycobacteroides abscessus subsp. abscessus]|nr:Uncharacterised protein [Mycobacteroides abscessus subsp. abscessus]
MTDLALPMTEPEARRITERIRAALDRVSTAWSELGERITEAYERRADLALGYGSWAEYAEAELRPSEQLTADIRRQLVGMLAAQGMSTRAIAPTVGAPRETVRRDTHLTQSGSPDQSLNSATRERLNHETGELVPETLDDFQRRVLTDAERTSTRVPLTGPGSVATPHVTGLDGKSYPRPEPTPKPVRPRTPITDAFWSALYDLNKKAESLQRLIEDDRFTRNGDAIATRNLPQMRQTASTVASVLAALEHHGS